jgi:hypothetical protein
MAPRTRAATEKKTNSGSQAAVAGYFGRTTEVQATAMVASKATPARQTRTARQATVKRPTIPQKRKNISTEPQPQSQKASVRKLTSTETKKPVPSQANTSQQPPAPVSEPRGSTKTVRADLSVNKNEVEVNEVLSSDEGVLSASENDENDQNETNTNIPELPMEEEDAAQSDETECTISKDTPKLNTNLVDSHSVCSCVYM